MTLTMIIGITLSILVAGAETFILSYNYQHIYAATTKNSTLTPIGSQTFLTVTTKVSGGIKKPSDFTITVSGKSPSPKSFSGSSSGTSVTLNAGNYKVTATGPTGYTTKYSSDCSGTASGGVPIKCTITNLYSAPPPGATTFLNVITKVDNTNGGTKKPSDFTITVSGNSPRPTSFSGSSSGTSVTLQAGKYKVTGVGPSGYTTKYSSGCSGTASGGTPVKCIVSASLSPPSPSPSPSGKNGTSAKMAATLPEVYCGIGSKDCAELSALLTVQNMGAGTKKPQDFTININGTIHPTGSHREFSGADKNIGLDLRSPGEFHVYPSKVADYTTKYELHVYPSGVTKPECNSPIVSVGAHYFCNIVESYSKPSPPPPPPPAKIHLIIVDKANCHIQKCPALGNTIIKVLDQDQGTLVDSITASKNHYYVDIPVGHKIKIVADVLFQKVDRTAGPFSAIFKYENTIFVTPPYSGKQCGTDTCTFTMPEPGAGQQYAIEIEADTYYSCDGAC